jgi:hypothetical protein
MHLAAESGYQATAKQLLEKGANAKARTKTSWHNGDMAAIHLAVGKGHEAVEHLLLGKGATD